MGLYFIKIITFLGHVSHWKRPMIFASCTYKSTYHVHITQIDITRRLSTLVELIVNVYTSQEHRTFGSSMQPKTLGCTS